MERESVEIFSAALADAFKQFGPLALTIAFFIYRDYKREQVLNEQNQSVQKEYTAALTTVVRDNTAAMHAASSGMRMCVSTMERLNERLPTFCKHTTNCANFKHPSEG